MTGVQTCALPICLLKHSPELVSLLTVDPSGTIVPFTLVNTLPAKETDDEIELKTLPVSPIASYFSDSSPGLRVKLCVASIIRTVPVLERMTIECVEPVSP